MDISMQYLVNSVVFSGLGILIFVVGFWLLDFITPYRLWHSICEEKNVALALFVGLCALGICIIIASAIH